MTASSAGITRVEIVLPRDGRQGRLLATAISALVCGGAASLVALCLDFDARARCEAERDQRGVGRAVALRALDAPTAYGQFLYRVTRDGSGYRAAVIVKDGPFVGDAWVKDAEGRIRHHSDVCRDTALLSSTVEDT